MKNKQTRILTGPIRSGKTTAISVFVKQLAAIDGILSPDLDGLRKLIHLRTGEVIPFQLLEKSTADDIKIGRFIFAKSAFDKAREILLALCRDSKTPIVVDEIGKLELEGRGFEPALSAFLKFHSTSQTPLLLVVRDYLLNHVIEKYGLHDAEIVLSPLDLA